MSKKKIRDYICKKCGVRFNISYKKIIEKKLISCPVCKEPIDLKLAYSKAVEKEI
jgi:DNA-directed RNA polymerase subunit RPC12/RpoP